MMVMARLKVMIGRSCAVRIDFSSCVHCLPAMKSKSSRASLR
jgi:hypothetical protein